MTAAPHADSYYAARATDMPDFPALAGAAQADVCIVGAGYAGLSAALELAERGFDVVVLEANRVGWGASGRNGGQICTGFSSGMDKIEGWIGKDDARRTFAIAEEAKLIIRERVARHKIDCDLRWGYFHGAIKPSQMRWLRDSSESLARDYGYTETRLVESREAVRAYVRTDAYVGGMYEGGAGVLNPLDYCLGLARAAAAAGVRIHEGSRVIALEQGARPRARCAGGEVSARYLILCGNAYLGDLVPALRGKVMPVGTYIGATPCLGEARARALMPGCVAAVDCNFALNYYCLSRDHRMLFGGRVSYSTLMPPNLPRAMRRKMIEVFPDLADVSFDYTWGGFVAITAERTPHIGRLGDNVYFAQGFSGQGVALTGVVGRLLAETIAGQAERFDLLTRLPHTTFPGGRLLRTPTLALAMLWYRLRDII